MKIRISANFNKWLAFLILYFTLFIGFFTEYLGLTNSVMYVADVLCLLSVIVNFPNIIKLLSKLSTRYTLWPLVLLLILGTISAVLYGFKPLLWIWAIRNWGRMFAFFCVCICVLDQTDIQSTIRFFKGFVHINTCFVIVQSIFLKNILSQDQLNGFFGRITSSIFVMFLLILMILLFSEYFMGMCTGKTLLLYLVEILVCATLAEIKALFFLVIIFFICYGFVNRRFTYSSIRKAFGIGIVTLIALFLFAGWLGRLYPQFADFFSVQNLIENITNDKGYGNTGYIDRLNGISIINKYFFDNMGWRYKLIGLGIGNGEYSNYPLFTSAFYNRYGTQYRYLNFTASDLYLETGICGLILYIVFFVNLFWKFVNKVRTSISKGNTTSLYYENIGMGMMLLSVILIFYNNLQRTDSSFLLAFFMSVPFVMERTVGNNVE